MRKDFMENHFFSKNLPKIRKRGLIEFAFTGGLK